MYSNTTPNYNLPHYIGSDKASWFDNNKANEILDTQLHLVSDKANETEAKQELTSNKVIDLQTKFNALEANYNVTKALAEANEVKLTNLETELSKLSNVIGNLNNLLTNDKTSIVNAINSIVEGE